MAALVNQDLVAREHPVFDPPYTLQPAYAADPGTFTKWLVEETATATLDETLAVLVLTNAKFDQIAARVAAAQEAQATALLKELAEDALAAEPLEMFLTVTVPEGGKAMVVTVARLARFRPELGQVSNWSGKVFGFLGEVEEGQLPPLVRLPDTLSLRQAMEPHNVIVPTWLVWNAHYGVGPDRIPIMEEDLLMSADEGTGRVAVETPVSPSRVGAIFREGDDAGVGDAVDAASHQCLGDRSPAEPRPGVGALVCRCLYSCWSGRNQQGPESAAHSVGVAGDGVGSLAISVGSAQGGALPEDCCSASSAGGSGTPGGRCWCSPCAGLCRAEQGQGVQSWRAGADSLGVWPRGREL